MREFWLELILILLLITRFPAKEVTLSRTCTGKRPVNSTAS